MIRLAIRQFWRLPLRNILAFLLMALSAALLALGIVMLSNTAQRMDAAEKQFATIGTVAQKPRAMGQVTGGNACMGTYTNTYDYYNEIISVEALDFPGANYVHPPENRPYYVFTNSYWKSAREDILDTTNSFVAEFIPLEDSRDGGPVSAETDMVLMDGSADALLNHNFGAQYLRVGDSFTFCQHLTEKPQSLEKGKTYISAMIRTLCPEHDEIEFCAYQAPFSSQYDSAGIPLEDGDAPSFHNLRKNTDGWQIRHGYEKFIPDFSDINPQLEEVTPELELNKWWDWARYLREYNHSFFLLPTNSLELLPTFHSRQAYIAQGRAITEEEFENGEKVCLIPAQLNQRNASQHPDKYPAASVGSRVTLSIQYSLYGYSVDKESRENKRSYSFQRRYSPLAADGEHYAVFGGDEYLIVGTYDLYNRGKFFAGSSELSRNTIIIPAKSVSGEAQNIAHFGPMLDTTKSFQIPNGTIEEFDMALRETVPKAAELIITYDDNGYTQVREGLENTRITALLLCAAGGFLAIGVIILTLYFFVVKEQKRTAIERSLGMSKRQCQVSLLCGLLLLTLTAAAVGSLCGGILANQEAAGQAEAHTEGGIDSGYSTQYSLWAHDAEAAITLGEEEASALSALYVPVFVGIPLAFLCTVWLLGVLLVNRNMKTDPIYLLGRKNEDS